MKLQHLFDSHAHYEDALFGEDRHRILAGLPDQGVEWVLNCCSDLGVAPLVVELTQSGNYQGQTILPLREAYIDARLLCRPDSDWLDTSAAAAAGEED